jgi:hypothetical protein
MHPLPRTILMSLAAERGAPRVSIFMPMTGDHGSSRPNVTRFERLLIEAEGKLREWGIGAGRAQYVLTPARLLLGDLKLWQGSGGLAVFCAFDELHHFRVPLALHETVMVSDRYVTRPLLPLLSLSGGFLVLALSRHGARLFECDAVEGHQVVSGLLPAEVSERAPDAAAPATADREQRREALLHAYRRMDDALQTLFPAAAEPLVLAGASSRVKLYRSGSRYPHLVPSAVIGNPDHLSLETLRSRAWEVVRPHLARAAEHAAARYLELAARRLASNDLERVVEAAHRGRVEALLLDPQAAAAWGSFTSAGARAGRRSGQGALEDLLESAAAFTLLNGGEVFALESPAIPGGGPIAALFRY